MVRWRKHRLRLAHLLNAIMVAAALVGAYYTHRTWDLSSRQPDVQVALYHVDGKEEVWDDDITAHPQDCRSRNRITEYELPLKVVNDGMARADEVTIWLRTDQGSLARIIRDTSKGSTLCRSSL